MSVSPTWLPSSWRERPAQHQPEWPEESAADAARSRLRSLPPLVFAGEARQLQAALAEVAAGRAFLLQAGDCAESFHDFSAITIREKLKIMLQMSAEWSCRRSAATWCTTTARPSRPAGPIPTG